MTGVPGQDAAIQEDVANTIAAITKTQTSIQNAVSHDFYAPLRAALPRFIFHSTGMDRIIGREILRCAFLACALGWQGGVPISVAQIYHVKEMNAEQIRALDRTKTVVILPGGILEEHGPYLPCFADGYMSERLTQELAEAILERKGWNVLVFPTIPLGTGGANEIGGKYSFSGTFAVRSSTLRAIFMDLASELGDQGFRWIFVIHIHGGLNHHRALDEAGEYFHDTYGGQMVPLGGLVPAQDLRSPEIREEEGFTVHADMEETSVDLFLCPRLVSPAFREARPQTGRNMDDLVGIARRNEWPGYFGSPRRASAAFGALHWRRFSSDAVGLALKILDGLDYRKLPRYWDMMRADPANVAVADAALDHEQEVERKQLEWLKKKGLR